jgi:Ser/Thr protein kinase RdoA (MazF antagonist)
MRQLAGGALEAYGLAGARFKLLRHAGNTLFRVASPDAAPGREATALYEPGQYLLRIHEPGYQATEAIALEMEWLAAMSREANLPVPEPVPRLDGRLLAQVSTEGVPEARNCSLLRWLKGRFLTKGIGPCHFRAQGRLMARLHDFAAHWQPPASLTKRHWDWDGLFGAVEGSGLPPGEAWSLLPPSTVAPFEAVARQVRQIMDEWGRGAEVYGLIHADLGVDANVLFWGSPPEARAIDFDDSGFGYWMYDLAVSLEHVRDDTAYPRFRDALLEGYAEHHTLPEVQLEQLELFMAAFYVYVSLWAAAMAYLHPKHREELFERLQRAAGLATLLAERMAGA